MKSRADRIQRIVSLAAADERREAIAMGRSQQEHDAACKQLDELRSYRRDYATQRAPGGTVSAVCWHDYQTFLARLDHAVKAQQQTIVDGEDVVEAHRRRWMAKRQRLESLQRVLERYRYDERVADDRRTQKMLDDLPTPEDLFKID